MEHAGTEKTGAKGNWLVISGSFGRYIVRTEMSREEVREARKVGGPLLAKEAFEFSSQVQIGQAPSPTDPRMVVPTVGKMNLVYRVDATCYPLDMEFPVQNSLIYWLDDLHQSDAPTYKDLLTNAVKMGEGWAAQRSENRSGVKLASAMPQMGVPGGFRG